MVKNEIKKTNLLQHLMIRLEESFMVVFWKKPQLNRQCLLFVQMSQQQTVWLTEKTAIEYHAKAYSPFQQFNKYGTIKPPWRM